VFAKALTPALKHVHRGLRHAGKSPGGAGVTPGEGDVLDRVELSRLEEELARAVAVEAYERAAELRDQIKCALKKAETA
jgi:protein arginine kinase activator